MSLPSLELAALTLDVTNLGLVGITAIALGIVLTIVIYTLGLRDQGQHTSARFVLLSLRLIAIGTLLVALLHPSWVTSQRQVQRPVMAVVLDDSASMNQPIDYSRKDSPTRFDQARASLQQIQSLLGPSHDLLLFNVEGKPLNTTPATLKASVTQTPLTHTLLDLQRDLVGRPVTGVVLLSDGTETDQAADSTVFERMKLPVHAVRVIPSSAGAGTTGPPDVAVVSVAANRRALVGNTVRVTIDASASGVSENVNLPVTILDGERVIAKSAMSWKPGQPTTRAEIEFVPRRAGEFTYSVQIGSVLNERDLANNRSSFPLTVRARALTVLYIDGVLRWEGKFIRQTLAADPDLHVISSIRTNSSTERGSEGLLLPEQLEKIDVVILGDIEVTHFSAREMDSLRKFVTEQGGGLIITGGYHGFGAEGFGRSELRTILPVEFSASSNPQIEQAFGIQLTDAGRESPIFHLTGDRVRDAAFYQSLPPLEGCSRIAGVKPGAQVLAVNPQARLADGASALPVMVVQQVGAGRTMVFAVDTTWKWRMVVGGFTGDDSFYRRFWGQLTRWMATGQEDAASQRLLVSTDRARYSLGQKVEIRAELRPTPNRNERTANAKPTERAATQPVSISNMRVSAQLVDENGARLSVPLNETSSEGSTPGSRVFRASATANQSGRMELLIQAEPGAESGSNQAIGTGAESRLVSFDVDRADSESIDPRANPQFLAAIARTTGGRMLEPEDLPEWARSLPSSPTITQHTRAVSLWHHPLLGLVLLLALIAEWILRRHWRLA